MASNSTSFRSGLGFLSNKRPKNPIQSKDKKLDDLARLIYLGAGNVVPGNSANYLFKTSYAFVAATATVCEVSTCIPVDQFVSGYSSVTCRRKRSLKNFEPIEEDMLNVDPSAVQQYKLFKHV